LACGLRRPAPRSESIASLVNRAYAPAVLELWTVLFDRVSVDTVADYISAGEIVVAEVSGTRVGCVRYRELDADTGWFGLLSVDPDHAGAGVGRILVDAVESMAAGSGRQWMELDLLIPAVPTPHQTRLEDWYARLGYVEISRDEFRMPDGALAAAMRSPCVSIRERKLLKGPVSGSRKE
jgi:GNAT superfamily N-acetyltransferase